MRTQKYWYEAVWNMGKQRFLQSEAANWMVGNKMLELFFLIGASIGLYFEFFVPGEHESVVTLVVMIVVFASISALERRALYNGYASGYEQGFVDAATRTMDYQDADYLERDLNSVLTEIQGNEEKVTSKNKATRWREIKRGVSKVRGFAFTWRKVTNFE